MTTNLAYYDSPIGLIEVGGTETAVNTLYFVEQRQPEAVGTPCLDEAVRQLEQYFAQTRQEFSLSLEPKGTNFQQAVWQKLLTVPYGHTVSYSDIANALGNPKAVRAVGAANGQNPISLIIPCHRIIGSNGKLTGYGGGLWRKEWLLRHEGCLLI
ncbi:MAG: methylated-DNA--[protein]-cysteine S-methyltransferase [Chloroflexota bacterium]